MALATDLQPRNSAAPSSLSGLVVLGYVYQDRVTERYRLSMKLTSIVRRHLSRIPMLDLAQPLPPVSPTVPASWPG